MTFLGRVLERVFRNPARRPLLLLLILVPLSFVSRKLRAYAAWWKPSPPRHHRDRVARVGADILRARNDATRHGTAGAIRTDRPGKASLSVRSKDDFAGAVRVGDLTAILQFSFKIGRGFVKVEPGVTVGVLMDELEGEGYMLESCIEMRDATIGGLVLSQGLTSHSHQGGLVADSVTGYEVVLADGSVVRATAENDHSELFCALPMSHGTLGIVVAIDLRVIPCPAHLRLAYHPVRSIGACHELMKDLALQGEEPWYLEAFVYSPTRIVVVEASFAEWRQVASEDLHVNNIGAWHKPWFYRHAEKYLDPEMAGGGVGIELVPTQAYLMRHNKSMCMTMDTICEMASAPWARFFFGAMYPLDMQLLKGYRPPAERVISMRQNVYQDYCIPASRFPALVEWLDENFSIYPLLVYPVSIFDKGGTMRLRSNRGKPVPSGRFERSLYLDVGIFGQPKTIRDGNSRFPTISLVRELEAKVREWGGFQHTYCDVFSTKEEFEQMFDLTLWRKMRVKYGASGIFPTIYDKVKPEVDIAPFLTQEKAWMGLR